MSEAKSLADALRQIADWIEKAESVTHAKIDQNSDVDYLATPGKLVSYPYYSGRATISFNATLRFPSDIDKAAKRMQDDIEAGRVG